MYIRHCFPLGLWHAHRPEHTHEEFLEQQYEAPQQAAIGKGGKRKPTLREQSLRLLSSGPDSTWAGAVWRVSALAAESQSLTPCSSRSWDVLAGLPLLELSFYQTLIKLSCEVLHKFNFGFCVWNNQMREKHRRHKIFFFLMKVILLI